MASKRKPRQDPSLPTTRADYTRQQWADIGRARAEMGRNTPANVQPKIEEAVRLSDAAKTESDARKYGNQANSLRIIKDALKPRPVTMRGAVEGRLKHFQAHLDQIRAGEGTNQLAWYATHREDVDAATSGHGVDSHTAAGMSGILSPGKNPKLDEIPAASALVRLHDPAEGHHVHLPAMPATGRSPAYQEFDSEELYNRLAGAGGAVGTPTSPLSGGPSFAADPRHLAKSLSLAAHERSKGLPRTVSSSMESFEDAGLAHAGQAEQAIRMARGEIHTHDAVSPDTAPKVTSYTRQIQRAEGMEALDLHGIAYHLANHDPNQSMIMWSQQEPGQNRPPRTSILSPEGDTAEDTWMMAIDSRQAVSHTGPDGKVRSPAKRTVSDGGPGSPYDLRNRDIPSLMGHKDLTPVGAAHAWSHEATVQAAAKFGPVTHNQHGEEVPLPSSMMQAGAWTNIRREAGADAEHNQAVRSRQAHFQSGTGKTDPNQGTLF